MDDGRWYLANIIFRLGSLVREVPDSIVLSSSRQRLGFRNKLKSDFRMVGYDRFFRFM